VSEQCVIYARVSTKEQQEEGYSIPAQLKAIRSFCVQEKLSPVAEFLEADTAGKTGRREFTRMLEYLRANHEVQVVVAHKLDRLYRNFRDQLSLEEDLGIRARYVQGDVPDTPQGEFVRDVMLSQAKFYLRNLSEEVRKGMDEKIAQGGWPHQAPVGYLNDKESRSVVIDPERAPIIRYAFERYSSGVVSLDQLRNELSERGLLTKKSKPIVTSAIHHILCNPFYRGIMRYKSKLYPGNHEPLVSPQLFQEVQERLSNNRHGTRPQKRTYALRGTLRCAECGCLITAGTHKGHSYYRCTHGKGKNSCSQRSYIREDLLMQQVESILAGITIGPDIVNALCRDAALLMEETRSESSEHRKSIERSLETSIRKESRLLDGYLDGTIPQSSYTAKVQSLSEERNALELALADLDHGAVRTIEQVRADAERASSATLDFQSAATEGKREVVETLLCNLLVEDGHISSYQYKDPFGVLQMDSSGVFKESWWAL